jgi:hypothetical protein
VLRRVNHGAYSARRRIVTIMRKVDDQIYMAF